MQVVRDSQRGEGGVRVKPVQGCRKSRLRLRWTRDTRNLVDVGRRKQKLIRSGGAYRVRFAKLALPPGLIGVGIEERADRIDVDGTIAVIVLDEEEYAVTGPSVPIHPSRHHGFTGWPSNVLGEMHCAGIGSAQSTRSRPTVAARGILRIEVARSRGTRPWRAFIKVEHLLVERVRCRPGSEYGIDIGHGCGFKCRAG